MSIIQIPFILNEENGLIEVRYEENKSAVESGFDIIKNLNFDVNMCIGYPTIHGYIKEFKATGYKRYCGWIQILKLEYLNSNASVKPDKVIKVVDCCPSINTPFFAYGYPAEIYDAPCNNLEDSYRLKWEAHTYLVTTPSSVNDNTISFLAGFKWGYDEWNEENNERKIEIYSLSKIKESQWQEDIEILRRDFPYLEYV